MNVKAIGISEGFVVGALGILYYIADNIMTFDPVFLAIFLVLFSFMVAVGVIAIIEGIFGEPPELTIHKDIKSDKQKEIKDAKLRKKIEEVYKPLRDYLQGDFIEEMQKLQINPDGPEIRLYEIQDELMKKQILNLKEKEDGLLYGDLNYFGTLCLRFSWAKKGSGVTWDDVFYQWGLLKNKIRNKIRHPELEYGTEIASDK